MEEQLEVPASFRASVRPEEFSVRVDTLGDGRVLSLSGEVDVLTAPLLWERLEAEIATGSGPVVLDLRETRFVDSMGLGVMVRAHKRLRQEGRTLILREPRGEVRLVLAVSGLDRALDIEPPVPDAPVPDAPGP